MNGGKQGILGNIEILQPHPNDHKIIIQDHNIYLPHIPLYMQQNSINLTQHLWAILMLQTPEDLNDNDPDDTSINDTFLLDHEILEHAMQHDLPIFTSIDGSLDRNGIATVTMCIIAPDIKDTDETGSSNWQSRFAKILLICSWCLPKHLGTSPPCINMAESLSFIIGEYTIPTDFPIIYITDSNNARALQKRAHNSHYFTHWKKVRCVKQGIEYSIASHLEYLTSK